MRALLPLLIGCGGLSGTPSVPIDADPPNRLSRLGLLDWDGEDVVYADTVVPYTLNTPLFSDHAVKRRGIWMPDGSTATWQDDAVFDFPVGTALMKSFLFPADLRSPADDLSIVETRLLIHTSEGWEAWPYLWDASGGDAKLAVGGKVVGTSVIGLDGEPLTFDYLVPQRNQCLDCHEKASGRDRAIIPIGPRARYLNHEGQLEDLLARGMLDPLPDDPPEAVDWKAVTAVEPSELDAATLTAAARDYLDINCAHCHHPGGTEGDTSRLYLNHDQREPFSLGVCKRPGSAGKGGEGRTFDIVPGDHERSILWYRMATEDLGSMMPDIGRGLVDQAGLDVVAAWIDGLEGDCE